LRHARFAHLHVHSEFTFGESALSLEAIVAAARRLKLPAIAITDRNNLHGAAQFSRLAWEAGVKPIIGCELTVSREQDGEPFHLVLLARDREGYGNLCRLVTAAYEVSIVEPSCPYEALAQRHTGLVALTGCERGLVGQHLAHDDAPGARLALQDLAGLFGDDLFLELHHHGRDDDDRVVRRALELGQELGLQPVATANCRWADELGQRALNALWSIREQGQSLALRYDGDFAITDPAVLAQRLGDLSPEALTNTLAVVDRCRLILTEAEEERGRPALPPPPGVDDASATLRERAWAGLEARLPPAAWIEERFRRLERELEAVGADAGRMLCLAEARRQADDLGVTIAADRGEPAGSVLAFALGLSEVDPVRHDVHATADKGRVELAVGPARRGELLDELVRQWSGSERLGEVCAARLLSFHRLNLRSLVRDLAPALNADDDAVKQALKTLEGEGTGPPPGTPAAALTETCRVFEGLAHKTTLHPSGLVLARRPLVEQAPLSRSSLELPVAQIDETTARDLGLPVLDLRGTRLLDVLALTRDLVRDGRGEEVEWSGLVEDPAGLRLIARGETHGVPLLDADTARELAARLASSSLREVALLVALQRQAPRREGIGQRYVERAQGLEPVPSLHSRVDPLLADTRGLILFREQVEQVAAALVHYEPAEARRLLEVVESGDSGALEAEQEHFMDAARRRRVKRELAAEVFRRLAGFARYGYGRAQATTAAALAVTAAAIKARYRPEFTAAMIAVGSGSAAQVAEILAEAAAGGLTVLPPDVNAGGSEATVEQGRLRLGLSHVLGVGEATALDVVAERVRKGRFESFDDLLSRAGPPVLGRRAARNLVLAGACDGFGEGRDVLLSRLSRQTWRGGRRQADLFAGLEAASQADESGGNEGAASAEEGEREALGFALADLPRPVREVPSLAEIAYLDDEGSEVCCGGEVLSVRDGIGRAAEGIAAVLWDGTGLIEVEPRPGQQVPVLGGSLEARGRLRRAREGRPAAVLEASCTGARPPTHAILLVTVPGGAQDPTLLHRLRRVLGDHPGQMRVHLHVATGDRSHATLALPDKSGIKLDKTLLTRLEELLGEGSWKIVEKKEASG